MGLAASQAKLLSITRRLSDNELSSQSITAAKLALSNQTSAASRKYINALNATELLYGTYDMNGNKTSVALTGNALSEYAPLKNQYALINSAGQVLVSETQANYYEKSKNIDDYLAYNGIEKIETSETRTVPNPDYDEYEKGLGGEETFDVPPTIDEIVYEYSDSDKAQWYVNLWHRMNGASDNKVGTQTTDTLNTTGNWDEMIHNENSTTSQRWAVLEDGLMNSSKWLQNALNQGTVTLEQVQYTGDGTESNTGLENVTWTSIIYTSAQDITEQTDETAIAKAEAEYQQAQNDIEAKDKQFDNMLKLLDTEHEALQTEYESVQQIINKNIQRTLKIYSA